MYEAAKRVAIVVTLLLALYLLWPKSSPVETVPLCAVVSGQELLKNKEALIQKYGYHIIHQSWRNERIPQGHMMKFCNTWNQFNPEALHVLWTDKDNRNLIETQYPDMLETYDNLVLDIMRADVARLFYVHQFGGLYVDLDFESRANFFDSIPSEGDVYVVHSPALFCEVQQNSMMFAKKPGHEYFAEVIKTIKLIADMMSVEKCWQMGLGRGCDNLALFHNPFTRKIAAIIFELQLTATVVLDKTYVRNKDKGWKLTLLGPDFFCGKFSCHHQLSTWSTLPKIVMTLWEILLAVGIVELAIIGTTVVLTVLAMKRLNRRPSSR